MDLGPLLVIVVLEPMVQLVPKDGHTGQEIVKKHAIEQEVATVLSGDPSAPSLEHWIIPFGPSPLQISSAPSQPFLVLHDRNIFGPELHLESGSLFVVGQSARFLLHSLGHIRLVLGLGLNVFFLVFVVILVHQFSLISLECFEKFEDHVENHDRREDTVHVSHLSVQQGSHMKGYNQSVREDGVQINRSHDCIPNKHVARCWIQHKFCEAVIPGRFHSLLFVALPLRLLIIVDSVVA